MLRIGVGPIAASAVAFATGFITYLWLMTGPAPVNAASGVHARVHSAFDAIDPALLDAGATTGSNVQVGFNARFASLDAANTSRFVLDRTDDRAEPGSAPSEVPGSADRRCPDPADPPSSPEARRPRLTPAATVTTTTATIRTHVCFSAFLAGARRRCLC